MGKWGRPGAGGRKFSGAPSTQSAATLGSGMCQGPLGSAHTLTDKPTALLPNSKRPVVQTKWLSALCEQSKTLWGPTCSHQLS